MESDFSRWSGETKADDLVQPHYKEAYRLAIDCLLGDGEASYQRFIKAENIWAFLSEEEIKHITGSAAHPSIGNLPEEGEGSKEDSASTGTYWPTRSDTDPPNLDLGWPDLPHARTPTSVHLLFNPAKPNSPTIKEVVRRNILDAKQVIAIVMDVFTDVDIFREVMEASARGVAVYILLDQSHYGSFLSIIERQDIQVQKLRNLRVRTVKGQEYCCRSGVKFHGALGQKFLLVDCQTVLFGSYSFMWSFEKINLSMMQVITGQLVETFDEEFRTLYARSTVPTPFQALESQREVKRTDKLDGPEAHGKPFERNDHLRHTLDAIYKQACERRFGFSSSREMEELPQVPLQPQLFPDVPEFYKRRSYAGERQEPVYLSKLSNTGSSNWNITADNSWCQGFSNNVDNQYKSYVTNTTFRGSRVRQSYHGHDKQIQNIRQNLPTLANTSKTFLRTWRIESYLNHMNEESPEQPDHYEMDHKMAQLPHSRIRSSVVFTSTIPEQPETNSYSNSSALSFHDTTRPHPNAFSRTQWSPSGVTQQNESVLQRGGVQLFENPSSNTSSGRDAIYASLHRAKSRFAQRDLDGKPDERYKRHSVADPRSSTHSGDPLESSGHIYASLPRRQGSFRQVLAPEHHRNTNYLANLNEDQRSVSHYDFKKADEAAIISRNIWQEPPLRTVSTSLLDREESSATKASSAPSQHFFKRSTKKIRSLLNIPQRGDGSLKDKNAVDFQTSNDSKRHLGNVTNSNKCTDSNGFAGANGGLSPGLVGETSAPRFSTDELHRSFPPAEAGTTSGSSALSQSSDATLTGASPSPKSPTNRLYSRFEPLFSSEAKSSAEKHQLSESAKTKLFVFARTEPATASNRYSNQHSHAQDKKFGRFFQRVGNLIGKSKQ